MAKRPPFFSGPPPQRTWFVRMSNADKVETWASAEPIRKCNLIGLCTMEQNSTLHVLLDIWGQGVLLVTVTSCLLGNRIQTVYRTSVSLHSHGLGITNQQLGFQDTADRELFSSLRPARY